MRARLGLEHPPIVALLRDQDDVIARWQLLASGLTANDVERMLRRRELTRPHPGVYVAHTGPLTPRQRQWVAVLAAWPAVLDRESALPLRQPPAVVQLAVAHGRKLVLPSGVTVRRVVDLDERASWNRAPPRMRLDDALIDEMSERLAAGRVDRAFGLLADMVTSRRTTPERVLERLQRRRMIAHRAMLTAMLTDARDGICSVLERGYRQRVERAHGLPQGLRQQASRSTGGLTLQDVRYLRFDLIVELDGSLGHSSAAERDADALRDLSELAGADLVTARVTHGLVFPHGCRTAQLVAAILARRGWRGSMRRCPQCPEA